MTSLKCSYALLLAIHGPDKYASILQLKFLGEDRDHSNSALAAVQLNERSNNVM